MVFTVRIFQTIIMALFIGGVFFDAGEEFDGTIVSSQSLLGSLLIVSVGLFVSILTPVSHAFMQDRTVVLRERMSGLYSVGTYYLVRNLT